MAKYIYLHPAPAAQLELNKRTETLRNRTVLRGYTHFVLDANYDYNLRSEKVCVCVSFFLGGLSDLWAV